MSSHAALGVVRAGVAVLKGERQPGTLASSYPSSIYSLGTGVRINCISPGQIDVGVDLKDIDMRGMASQLPPASLQSNEVRQYLIYSGNHNASPCPNFSKDLKTYPNSQDYGKCFETMVVYVFASALAAVSHYAKPKLVT